MRWGIFFILGVFGVSVVGLGFGFVVSGRILFGGFLSLVVLWGLVSFVFVK